MLENQKRLLRRRLVRQTLQKRHRVRMAELRVPCLAYHDALSRTRPDARHPPFAGLRKLPRDRPMLNLDAPDCNPPKRRQSDRGQKQKTDFTQKYKPHPKNGRETEVVHSPTFWFRDSVRNDIGELCFTEVFWRGKEYAGGRILQFFRNYLSRTYDVDWFTLLFSYHSDRSDKIGVV